MADETTTDSTQTTETQTQPEGSPSSDTTSQQIQASEGGSTLLTGGTDGGDQAGKPADADAGQGAEQTEADPRAAFYGAPEGDAGYELALPEGVEVDKSALEVITPIAKELNLSSEGLSKIASVYAEKVLPSVVERVNAELDQNITATRAAWATEAREQIGTDPTFDGKSYDDVLKVSAKTLDRFGGEEFRKYLDETGLGNHPAMLKVAYQIGKAISEDSFERGGATTTPKTSVEKFYGTT